MSVDTLKGGSSVSTFILSVRTLKVNRGHPERAGIKHVYQRAEFAIHMEFWRMYGSNVQVNTRPNVHSKNPEYQGLVPGTTVPSNRNERPKEAANNTEYSSTG